MQAVSIFIVIEIYSERLQQYVGTDLMGFQSLL